jgi:hypothetical protein
VSPLPLHTKSNSVYPRYLGKEMTVRDRYGTEYHGTLKAWRDEFILLANTTEDILISRENDNIVSIRVKTGNGNASRKDRNVVL